MRIRVSYEKLNQICELSQLPILPVHQVPDALGSGGVFSLFDGAPRICKAEWRPLCYVLRFLVVNETSSSIRASRRGRGRVLTAQDQGRRRKLSSKLSGFGRQARPRNRSGPPKEYLGKRLPRSSSTTAALTKFREFQYSQRECGTGERMPGVPTRSQFREFLRERQETPHPLCYVLRFLVVNETSSSIRAPRRGRGRVLTAQGQGRRRKLTSKLSGFGRQAGPRNRSRPPKEYLGKRLPRSSRTTAALTKFREFQYSQCCLLYTSPSPRDKRQSRMPSSA